MFDIIYDFISCLWVVSYECFEKVEIEDEEIVFEKFKRIGC